MALQALDLRSPAGLDHMAAGLWWAWLAAAPVSASRPITVMGSVLGFRNNLELVVIWIARQLDIWMCTHGRRLRRAGMRFSLVPNALDTFSCFLLQ